MDTTFWINNPKVLLKNKYILELWPQHNYSLERKLNSITRLMVILVVFGYSITKSINIIVTFILTLVILIILYNIKKGKKLNKINIVENFDNKKNIYSNDKFTLPTKKNPFMNVSIDELTYKPNRPPAALSYNKDISKKILNLTKPNDKLFNNLGDNINQANFLRNFNTMPNTKIPNDQNAFLKYCYGDMKSCKEGDDLECLKYTTRKV
tara:strand:+ start:3472 stop:4098 length:627 start_codon:yes stop_codon:yes gene_type:complete